MAVMPLKNKYEKMHMASIKTSQTKNYNYYLYFDDLLIERGYKIRHSQQHSKLYLISLIQL